MLSKLLLTAALVSTTYGARSINTALEPDIEVGKFVEVHAIDFGSLSQSARGVAPMRSVLARLSETSLAKTTTLVGLKGNLSSSIELGREFLKATTIFVEGVPHALTFQFTRLTDGRESFNKVRYETIITVRDGVVRRNDASGLSLNSKDGAPLILTFNALGHLNLFDYGQPTASDVSPQLYVEFPDSNQSASVKWDVGNGLGESDLVSIGRSDRKESHLSAYDANSIMTDEWSEENCVLCFKVNNSIHHE